MFSSRSDRGNDIQKVRVQYGSRTDHAYTPALLDDMLDGAVRWILDKCDRLGETRRVQPRSELRLEISGKAEDEDEN